MNKPKDFDKVQGYGAYTILPAGNYVCKIMSVEETTSRSGKDMLVISLDIAEGAFTDYFAKAWREDTRDNKKWGCRSWVMVNDYQDSTKTSRNFKTFITSVEKSNSGFSVKWGEGFEDCFKGKLVGVQFRREEYLDYLSVSHWSTRPVSFRSVDSIRDGGLEVLADKPLNPAQASTAVEREQAPGKANLADFEDVISEGDLPF